MSYEWQQIDIYNKGVECGRGFERSVTLIESSASHPSNSLLERNWTKTVTYENFVRNYFLLPTIEKQFIDVVILDFINYGKPIKYCVAL